MRRLTRTAAQSPRCRRLHDRCLACAGPSRYRTLLSGGTIEGDPTKGGNVAASPITHEFHLPLDSDDRAVAGELQRMLVDLVDLALIGKQAHWNVEGAHFRSVHLFLDELVESWLPPPPPGAPTTPAPAPAPRP